MGSGPHPIEQRGTCLILNAGPVPERDTHPPWRANRQLRYDAGVSPDRLSGASDDVAAIIRDAQKQLETSKGTGAPAKSASSLGQFTEQASQLSSMGPQSFTPSMWRIMASHARAALREAALTAVRQDPNNTWAHEHAVEAMRGHLRQVAAGMNPPPEALESADYKSLMATLNPAMKKLSEAGYTEEAIIKGSVRADVLNRQVSEAVAQADKAMVNKRVESARRAGLDSVAVSSATRSLLAMIRLVKKRQKKKAREGELGEAGESTGVTKEEAEELSGMALEVMHTLREEFAPRWAPTQQPWFLNAADQEVYNILLSVVPEGLFQETQAYGEMQSLRAGDQVFTLRAADKINEAMKRK